MWAAVSVLDACDCEDVRVWSCNLHSLCSWRVPVIVPGWTVCSCVRLGQILVLDNRCFPSSHLECSRYPRLLWSLPWVVGMGTKLPLIWWIWITRKTWHLWFLSLSSALLLKRSSEEGEIAEDQAKCKVLWGFLYALFLLDCTV